MKVSDSNSREFIFAFAVFGQMAMFLIGGMFVSSVYLVPEILGLANCAPRGWAEKIIELTVIFASFFTGYSISILSLKVFSYFFMDASTCSKWVSGFDNLNGASSIRCGINKIISKHLIWAFSKKAIEP